MDKRERLESLKKLRNQVMEIAEQKTKKKENNNLKKDNQKRLLLTKKDGFINMSLIVEVILGITLAVGTMSIINTILTEMIK